MSVPGFSAEMSLKGAGRTPYWSSIGRSNAVEADVSTIAPALGYYSCEQARKDCADGEWSFWMVDPRHRCGGYCVWL